MHYTFPTIETIDQVFPTVEGRKDFSVSVKEDYTVICYIMMADDTFPPIGGEHEHVAQIRRECRGIVFCNHTGKILRRPYHKFFNVGQVSEVAPSNVDLSKSHILLDKADGSMIAPFKTHRGQIVWGTKMCSEDFHERVEKFVACNPHYSNFVEHCIDFGMTPIFEYVAQTNRIVLEYEQEDLILTAIRENYSGRYVPFDEVGIPASITVIRSLPSYESVDKLLSYARDLSGIEGFVVRFDDGMMAKVKTEEYIKFHRAKEKILFDRHIVEMILDQSIDDVKSMLPPEDCDNLSVFESKFVMGVYAIVDKLIDIAVEIRFNGMTRKDFALAFKGDLTLRALIFTEWDSIFTGDINFFPELNRVILKHTNSNTNWESFRDRLLPGVVYNG